MRSRKAIGKLAELLKEPSFTSRQAARCGVSASTLAHYCKAGELVRLGHGVYRSKNARVPKDFRWEDLVVAAQRVRGGVVCLVSALSLYALTDEIPRQHWIAIRNSTSHRADSTIKIVRMRNLSLGRTTTKLDGITLPIFDRERTLVDAFRYLGREAAIKALKRALTQKGSAKINPEKLRKYAKVLRFDIEPFVLAITT